MEELVVVYIIYITVASQWARWRLKSPATRLSAQSSVQAQVKHNIKILHHWPLWGGSAGDKWIPLKMASNAEMFPFDDAIMYLTYGLYTPDNDQRKILIHLCSSVAHKLTHPVLHYPLVTNSCGKKNEK